MSDTNEYEERNRAAKVYRLVRLCEHANWTPDDVAGFTYEQWERLAGVADVRSPSDRTKAIVLHVLRERANG